MKKSKSYGEALSEAIPAIMKHKYWKEMKPYISPVPETDRDRAHFNFYAHTPLHLLTRWKRLKLKCENPNCTRKIRLVREHGGQCGVYITGPWTKLGDDAHFCHNNGWVSDCITNMMIDMGQAPNSDRIKKALKALAKWEAHKARNPVFDFDEDGGATDLATLVTGAMQ